MSHWAYPTPLSVTCVLSQKNGAGMQTSAAAFWDTRHDGLVKVPFENSTIHALVTVFGLAVSPSETPAEVF